MAAAADRRAGRPDQKTVGGMIVLQKLFCICCVPFFNTLDTEHAKTASTGIIMKLSTNKRPLISIWNVWLSRWDASTQQNTQCIVSPMNVKRSQSTKEGGFNGVSISERSSFPSLETTCTAFYFWDINAHSVFIPGGTIRNALAFALLLLRHRIMYVVRVLLVAVGRCCEATNSLQIMLVLPAVDAFATAAAQRDFGDCRTAENGHSSNSSVHCNPRKMN